MFISFKIIFETTLSIDNCIQNAKHIRKSQVHHIEFFTWLTSLLQQKRQHLQRLTLYLKSISFNTLEYVNNKGIKVLVSLQEEEFAEIWCGGPED